MRSHNKAIGKSGTGLVLILAWSVMASSAAAAEFYLIAGKTTLTMPDGQDIPMWGFGLGPGSGGDGTVTVPGPPLVVPHRDSSLVIHLENNLPVPVSIVIPGQAVDPRPVKFSDSQGRERVRSFTRQVNPGRARAYRWSNFKGGTFLYHSGTHPAVQVQMGLYGGVKKDTASGLAYPGIPYDNELLLLYSEIDPALHQAVDDGSYGTPPMTSTVDYKPKYFLINGLPHSAGNAAQLPTVIETERVLLRFLNAGLRTHVPLLLGLYMRVVAEDGNPYPYPKQQYSLMLPALQTKDAIVSFPAPGSYPIFDRRFDLTDAGAADGGMLTTLQVVIADCNNNGISDTIEPDADGDGIIDDCDNCPDVFNPDQADTDGDGVGDACEPAPFIAREQPEQPACCGSAGPVSMLGLPLGMLLLGRLGGYRRRNACRAKK